MRQEQTFYSRAFEIFRNFLITVLLMLGLFLVSFITSQAHAVTLKNHSIVQSGVITLGDLFTDLPRDEDRVLGAAPRPGKDMVLNARTLLRVALAMDLPWRPASSADQIVVQRAASIVRASEVEDTLKNALRHEGISGNFQLITSSSIHDIILPLDQSPSIDVSTIEYDPTRNWFTAELVAPSRSTPIETIQVSGRVERLIDVPVLKSSLRNGAVIGPEDIEYLPVKEQNLKHDIILNAKSLVGMTPRRMVLPGKPVEAHFVEHPQVVGRGDLVTMIYKRGPLFLTAQGRALEDGSMNEVIRVVNMGSNQTLQGRVTNQKEITVE